MTLTEKLEKWVVDGGCRIGEVSIQASGDGFVLRHVDDVGREGLESFESAPAVRMLVRYDDAGAYRMLKSAPNLKHGWELTVASVGELREALDYLYPAAVGVWFANLEAEIAAVPLRVVLGRQTGMYRFANNLSDAGAQALVGQACGAAGGCLRRVCWPLAPDQAITSLPETELSREVLFEGEMPILCVEACNLLVAEARKASAKEFEASQDKNVAE